MGLARSLMERSIVRQTAQRPSETALSWQSADIFFIVKSAKDRHCRTAGSSYWLVKTFGKSSMRNCPTSVRLLRRARRERKILQKQPLPLQPTVRTRRIRKIVAQKTRKKQ